MLVKGKERGYEYRKTAQKDIINTAENKVRKLQTALKLPENFYM